MRNSFFRTRFSEAEAIYAAALFYFVECFQENSRKIGDRPRFQWPSKGASYLNRGLSPIPVIPVIPVASDILLKKRFFIIFDVHLSRSNAPAWEYIPN